MIRHTKGPWEWARCGNDYCLWGAHGIRPIVLNNGRTMGSRGRSVLRCRDTNDLMKSLDPGHPDMRLIAQAPRMYALVAQVAKHECTCADGGPDFCCDACEARGIVKQVEA